MQDKRDKMSFLIVFMLAGFLLLIAGMIIGDVFERRYEAKHNIAEEIGHVD